MTLRFLARSGDLPESGADQPVNIGVNSRFLIPRSLDLNTPDIRAGGDFREGNLQHSLKASFRDAAIAPAPFHPATNLDQFPETESETHRELGIRLQCVIFLVKIADKGTAYGRISSSCIHVRERHCLANHGCGLRELKRLIDRQIDGVDYTYARVGRRCGLASRQYGTHQQQRAGPEAVANARYSP